jgi:hypothetical protein
VADLERWAKKMQYYKELSPGFSTADTRSSPSLSFHRRILQLRFQDHAGVHRLIEFDGALAFRWSEEDEDSAATVVLYDRVYEVEASTWRARFLAARSASEPPLLRHFKLCFNAMGECLDVLAAEMRKTEPNQPLQHNAGTAPSADEALPPRG